jgi:hypothetical protein
VRSDFYVARIIRRSRRRPHTRKNPRAVTPHFLHYQLRQGRIEAGLDNGSGIARSSLAGRIGLDKSSPWWDCPTMKLVADQKRRVVLPKPVEPGDVFELEESAGRLVLIKLVRPAALRPPVAASPADPRLLKGIDLDEPAFAPISDESPA